MQKDNATIGKIVKALWDMQRLDVISRIKDPINGMENFEWNFLVKRYGHKNLISLQSWLIKFYKADVM